MKIITLTLNPAYDVHCDIASFRPFHENYVSQSHVEAGGKGVNVSRALTVNHVPNTAFVVLGKQNAAAFEGALLEYGIRYSGIYHSGKIRENITLHSAGMEETRLSFEGSVEDETFMDQVEYLVLSDCDADTVLVLSGRVPNGISIDRIRVFLDAVKDVGTRVVIDSNSFSIGDYLAVKPFLIKPNQEEVSRFTGRSVDSLDVAEQVANSLCRSGIENVLVSMGAMGMAYAGPDGHFSIPGKKIDARSTIGAGDSAIAGFLCGMYKGLTLPECAKMAFAFGTASCLRMGTLPPLPENVREIYETV